VQQLSIFDFLENDEYEQQEGFFYTGGAMYELFLALSPFV
jgi:hypothetical protein